ncbi:MAG: T9SS type A sorting domain-containing protein, partial [Bacteroidales bacterium]|nr:T9SS type A sorting domain-containing protein [Bacteroidales bacterium]
YAGDLKISSLGVSEYDQSALAFLGQNFPNPFSINTTINYGIYQDGAVLLSIFDVSGRRIQILEDAYRTRGRYTVTFENASLEPGIYYYQLEFSGKGILFSETKKMIVH